MPPRIGNLSPLWQVEKEIVAPASLEVSAVLLGFNLKRLQALAGGDPKSVNSEIARSDPLVVKGLKSILRKVGALPAALTETTASESR